jgi:hypothetical protein
MITLVLLKTSNKKIFVKPIFKNYRKTNTFIHREKIQKLHLFFNLKKNMIVLDLLNKLHTCQALTLENSLLWQPEIAS